MIMVQANVLNTNQRINKYIRSLLLFEFF